jgi:hypothetical protein
MKRTSLGRVNGGPSFLGRRTYLRFPITGQLVDSGHATDRLVADLEVVYDSEGHLLYVASLAPTIDRVLEPWREMIALLAIHRCCESPVRLDRKYVG